MLISKTHRFTKNIVSLLTGQSLNLLLNFFSITLVARYLGVNDFGVFIYSVAIVTVVAKVIDFGLVPIVFRETSKVEVNYKYLNTAITLRVILFVIILPLFNIVIIILDFSSLEVILLNILFLNIFISSKFQNVRELLDIPFKVSLTSHHSMIAILFDNFLFLVLILIKPLVQFGLLYVVISYVICNIPGFTYLVITLYRKYNFKFHFSLYKAKWLLKESLPLFVYVILAVLFHQLDVIVLKILGSEYDVGIYSAAMRLTLPLMIIPSALISTVFPTLVKNVGVDERKNMNIIKFLLKLLFFISFLLTISIAFKAEEVVTIIFGNKYLQSSLPVMLLLIVQIFLFNNFSILNFLTVYKKQRNVIVYSITIVIVNFIANITLIPSFSYTGAAVAKLISIILGSLILFIVIKRIKLNFDFFSINILFWIITVFIILFILSNLSLVLYIITSLVLIAYITWKLKYFNNEELLMILKIIDKDKWSKRLLSSTLR